jgi:hypothetical protein
MPCNRGVLARDDTSRAADVVVFPIIIKIARSHFGA